MALEAKAVPEAVPVELALEAHQVAPEVLAQAEQVAPQPAERPEPRQAEQLEPRQAERPEPQLVEQRAPQLVGLPEHPERVAQAEPHSAVRKFPFARSMRFVVRPAFLRSVWRMRRLARNG